MLLLAYGALLYYTTTLFAGIATKGEDRFARILAVLTICLGLVFNTLALLVLADLESFSKGPRILSVALMLVTRGKWCVVSVCGIVVGALWWQYRPSPQIRVIVAKLAACCFVLAGMAGLIGQVQTGAFSCLYIFGVVAFVLQCFALREQGNLLRTAYMVRMPLLSLAALALLGPLSVGKASSTLKGLFDMESGLALFFVGLVAGLIGCAAVAEMNLVFYYGRDRTGDKNLDFLDPHAQPGLTFLTGIAPAMVLVGCAASVSELRDSVRCFAPGRWAVYGGRTCHDGKVGSNVVHQSQGYAVSTALSCL